MKVMNKAIVLLSGGLDSVVSLALLKQKCDEILTLTFNYGQNALMREIKTAKNISDFYSVKNIIIDLPFLKDICENATVKQNNKLWIPNRNALFVNVAACCSEAMGYDTIVLGANLEESLKFKDNSADFVDAVNLSLKNSVNTSIKLVAPLINMNKTEIVKTALDLNVPLELVYSCYLGDNKNCGVCESCRLFKNALIQNGRSDLAEKLFDR